MKTPTPRTVDQIDEEIRIAELALNDSRRLHNTIRATRIPDLMAAGDESSADHYRKQEASLEADIERLTKRTEELRLSRGSAKARDQGNKRASAYNVARSAVAEAARNVAAIDAAIDALTAAINTAILGIGAADAAMQRAGVAPMHDLVTEQMIQNTVDMKLYVSSDGKFGTQAKRA